MGMAIKRPAKRGSQLLAYMEYWQCNQKRFTIEDGIVNCPSWQAELDEKTQYG
jgi:hypothetical protein